MAAGAAVALAGLVAAPGVASGQAPGAPRPPAITVTELVGPADCEPCGGDRVPMRTAMKVNERGQVAGTSYVNPLAPTAVLWDAGTATRLAPADFPHPTAPTDINDRGQIVGYTAFSALPFSWSDGDLTLIETADARRGQARAVNERGDVLVSQFAATPTGTVQNAGVWRGGGITMAPFGPETVVVPVDVNDRRQALVDRRTLPGGQAATAAVWQVGGPGGGGVTGLGTLGGATSTGADINETGHVAGASETAAGDRHAVLWRRGRTVDLGTLGGTTSSAVALNDRGHVVGTAQTAAGDQHAFLWRRGRLIDLGTLGGATSRAVGLNERGQVVGVSDTAAGEQHAFLWQRGRMVDLGAVAGGGRSDVTDINDRGQVTGSVGTGLDQRAVLWSVRTR